MMTIVDDLRIEILNSLNKRPAKESTLLERKFAEEHSIYCLRQLIRNMINKGEIKNERGILKATVKS